MNPGEFYKVLFKLLYWNDVFWYKTANSMKSWLRSTRQNNRYTIVFYKRLQYIEDRGKHTSREGLCFIKNDYTASDIVKLAYFPRTIRK